MRRAYYSLAGVAAFAAALWATMAPGTAHAFCGFYVSGGGAELFNNATQVVLMREGTRTVLSMQNNYQGPPESFAMVVPVPVVLQEENVKTLGKDIFQRVDQLAAPRLVEYWEQDPCKPVYPATPRIASDTRSMEKSEGPAAEGASLGVTIEAQFAVGEYQIVILSAKNSTGLDTWLRQEKYRIPEGAEPVLKPYVEAGSKFFVAKVDATKVQFKDGMAMLSPLRFHYDSNEFSLPVRLGLINSSGTQDLIVTILARGQRYEVANYKNVTIPTNLEVKDEVRNRFGEFYAALFDATLEKNPGAVVTEYSWDASTCDPCPTPALSPSELATLGADVLDGAASTSSSTPARTGPPLAEKRLPPPSWRGGSFVLTRLHARYTRDSMTEDLVFRAAPPISGGREIRVVGDQIEQGARPDSLNMFQGRYIIRHPWTGPIECENPRRGMWGGPPDGASGSTKPQPAVELAFAPRGKASLASFVAQDVPELAIASSAAGPAADSAQAGATDTKPEGQAQGGDKPAASGQSAAGNEGTGSTTAGAARAKSGCCSAADSSAPVGTVLLALATLLGLGLILRRTSRRC